MPKQPLTPEEKKARKKRNLKRRLYFYGTILGSAWIFVAWQPWDFDIIPRKPPKPNPPVDPGVNKLFSKGTKVLLVTAHPDDSGFYIGGTLTQLGRAGADIYQVIVTDGDKRYYPIQDWQANRKVRREEAIDEIRAWNGHEISFLGYPDGRLKVTDRLIDDLANHISRINPEYVLCFDSEYPPRMSHRDHRRAGEATVKAAQKAGFEGWILRFSTMGENWIRDISDDWEAKAELLKIHKSQFHGERLEGVSNMVMGTAEDFGNKIGVGFAEGFRCSRL